MHNCVFAIYMLTVLRCIYRDLFGSCYLNIVGSVSALSELIRLSDYIYLFTVF